MEWTTPEDIAAQVSRRWEDGSLLTARLSGEALFPMKLRLWVSEPEPFAGVLERLTPPELELFDDLKQDRLGLHVRLEQERIAFGKVR